MPNIFFYATELNEIRFSCLQGVIPIIESHISLWDKERNSLGVESVLQWIRIQKYDIDWLHGNEKRKLENHKMHVLLLDFACELKFKLGGIFVVSNYSFCYFKIMQEKKFVQAFGSLIKTSFVLVLKWMIWLKNVNSISCRVNF